MKTTLIKYILLFLNSTQGRKVTQLMLDKIMLVFWNITLGKTGRMILQTRSARKVPYEMGMDLDDTETTQPQEEKIRPRTITFNKKIRMFARKNRVLTDMVTPDALAGQQSRPKQKKSPTG